MRPLESELEIRMKMPAVLETVPENRPEGAERAFHRQPARKRGPQFHNHKELSLANRLNKLKSGLIPRASRKNAYFIKT